MEVPSHNTATALALRSALLFAGFSSSPPPRVASLIEASTARSSGCNLDSASSDFQQTVQELRTAAGFGDSPAWHTLTKESQPWATDLEAQAPMINAELMQAMAELPAADWGGAEYEAIAAEWKFLHLWQDGEWMPDAIAQFPRTVALLQDLEATRCLRLNPLQNVACGFARQPMDSGISPHCDGNLLGLTAHLGLQVPSSDCWIEVGGERRSWEENRLLLMDTTQLHRTQNGGSCDRYILMLNVLRPEVDVREVRAFQHYLRAPPLRLDGLNPGWLSVPSGVLTCAPSAVDDNKLRVQLEPIGSWLPQREQGGDNGLVRFEPLAGRRYRVASENAMQPRQLPSERASACDALPPYAPGSEVEPCAAAIDSEGCLEWIAVPLGSATGWLRASDAGGVAEDGDDDEPSIPTAVLEAHLRLLREPQSCLAWLPVYDSEDTELLERLG